MFSNYIMIALGGAMGSITRVALSQIFPSHILGVPLQILSINILGCFMIGALAEFMAFYWSTPDHVRHFLIPGFLGGFTTFSSFALEFGLLFEKNQHAQAISYVLASMAISLIAFFLGMKLVKFMGSALIS